MRGTTPIIALALLASLSIFTGCDNRPPSERIVGKWQTNVTETTDGETQLFYHFSTEGTLTLTGTIAGETISSSCQFKVADDKLELIGAGLTSRTAEGLINSGTIEIEFRGDRLYLKENGKTRVVLARTSS